MISHTKVKCERILTRRTFLIGKDGRRLYKEFMSRVLVVGMGYLGTAAAGQALQDGYEVARASLEPGEGMLAVDLGDRESVQALAARVESPDAVIHCASTSHGGTEAYRRVFVEGCRNLTECFPGSRVVMCSSCSVYPQQGGEKVTEDSPVRALSENAELLLEAEKIVLAAGGSVARLSNLYGPGRSVLLTRFLEGYSVLEEDGKRFVNHIHRDDAAAALILLATREECAGQIYNVTDSLPLNQKKMYRALCALFLKPPLSSGPRLESGKRPWTNKALSSEKLQATGWTPRYPSFLDAVPDLVPTLDISQEESEDE